MLAFSCIWTPLSYEHTSIHSSQNTLRWEYILFILIHKAQITTPISPNVTTYITSVRHNLHFRLWDISSKTHPAQKWSSLFFNWSANTPILKTKRGWHEFVPHSPPEPQLLRKVTILASIIAWSTIWCGSRKKVLESTKIGLVNIFSFLKLLQSFASWVLKKNLFTSIASL